MPRIDIPAIVTGQTTYIQNVRVPGMLHGRVVRPRGQAALIQGATPAEPRRELDRRTSRTCRSCRMGNFVGVVAPKEYARDPGGRRCSRSTWDNTPSLPGDGDLDAAPCAILPTCRALLSLVDKGDVGAGFAAAAKTVPREATSPLTSFTVRSARTALSPTSARTVRRSSAPRRRRTFSRERRSPPRSTFPPAAVRVQVFPASGNYGHNTYDDASISAALLVAARSASRCGCSSCAGTNTAGTSWDPPSQPTSVPASTQTASSSPTTTRPTTTAGRR